MGISLNKNSGIECRRHGLQRSAFICQHLQYGEGIGYFEATGEPDPEYPFREAWCGDCGQILLEQGEWNDVSEGHAQIMTMCEGC
ncbi:MAG: hypothetical protein HQK65_08865 [Desulfamplus sp.]|nr:hypothetical protein [Desulfamplus sp.]